MLEVKTTEHDVKTAADRGAAIYVVRASSHPYLSALLLLSLFSAFCFYIGYIYVGTPVLIAAWLLLPLLAITDRIEFDGRRISRKGTLPRLWARLTVSRTRLKLRDIEQVETLAIRAARRGGNVFYRYRTTLRGKGLVITVASGGRHYRRFLTAVLSQLSDDVMDSRSIELRDHLVDPKEISTRVEDSRIPSADFLEASYLPGSRPGRSLQHRGDDSPEIDARELHHLANDLRIAGRLLQALEAFRRALLLRPKDARLLFDFARCLYTFSVVQRDNRLKRRALATLRLTERRAGDDNELLVHLAEWHLHIGNGSSASRLFRTVIEVVGHDFRAIRGLAEVALQEGKIAHVVHHFSGAADVAGTSSLRRWSAKEAEYFHNLSSDPEYLEMEIGRVNTLESTEKYRRSTIRIVLLSLPLILIGIIFADDVVANAGWAISFLALTVWLALVVSGRTLSRRIPYDIFESQR